MTFMVSKKVRLHQFVYKLPVKQFGTNDHLLLIRLKEERFTIVKPFSFSPYSTYMCIPIPFRLYGSIPCFTTSFTKSVLSLVHGNLPILY